MPHGSHAALALDEDESELDPFDPDDPWAGEDDHALQIGERLDIWRRKYMPLPDEVVYEFLGEEEYVVHSDHPSFRAFLTQNIAFVVLIPIVGPLFIFFLQGGITRETVLVFLILDLLVAALALRRLGDRYTSYVITNMRLIKVTGILSRKLASIPWTGMTGLGYRQTAMGRVLGYATIKIESANEESGLREFSDVNDPALFHQRLLDMAASRTGQSQQPPPPTTGERHSLFSRKKKTKPQVGPRQGSVPAGRSRPAGTGTGSPRVTDSGAGPSTGRPKVPGGTGPARGRPRAAGVPPAPPPRARDDPGPEADLDDEESTPADRDRDEAPATGRPRVRGRSTPADPGVDDQDDEDDDWGFTDDWDDEGWDVEEDDRDDEADPGLDDAGESPTAEHTTAPAPERPAAPPSDRPPKSAEPADRAGTDTDRPAAKRGWLRWPGSAGTRSRSSGPVPPAPGAPTDATPDRRRASRPDQRAPSKRPPKTIDIVPAHRRPGRSKRKHDEAGRAPRPRRMREIDGRARPDDDERQ